jgi:hypothetical protein
MKQAPYLALIVVTGALLGSVLGTFLGNYFPAGNVHDLFATNVTAGLPPTTLDLRLIEFTFGVVLKLNFTSFLGIIVSAVLFRGLGH